MMVFYTRGRPGATGIAPAEMGACNAFGSGRVADDRLRREGLWPRRWASIRPDGIVRLTQQIDERQAEVARGVGAWEGGEWWVQLGNR